MKLFPYCALSLRSELTPDAIAALFGSCIEKQQWMRFSGGDRRFQGSFSSNTFTISRIIGYRNSFIPFIFGKVEPLGEGSLIRLVMRPHMAVSIFMSIWFSGVIFGACAVIFGLISGKTPPHPMLLIPFGMLLFGVALVSGGFWFEASKQMPMLLDLFKATEIPNDQIDSGAHLTQF